MPDSVCGSPIGDGFSVASDIVPDQFQWFTGVANQYIIAANTFTQTLADYDIIPLDLQPTAWNVNNRFEKFEPPKDPDAFVQPNSIFGEEVPQKASDCLDNNYINIDGLNGLLPPTIDLPDAPTILIPPPPVVALPSIPSAPTVNLIDTPEYVGEPLPEVPTLYQLSLPEVPTINIDDLNIERPQFVAPDALEDTYRPDFIDFHNVVFTGVTDAVGNTGVTDMHSRLQTMIAGGTGLPANIEQALFDRAIGRDEVSSVQAIAQSEQEWAAKGFDLPGSTLLARTQEIRQASRSERGRVNRELSIQFHNQEIENLRFSVQQGIALEGQLLQAYTQIYDTARQLADGHFVVAKSVFDTYLDQFRLQLQIYQTDTEVYKIQLEAELTKLEVYKSELEAQRIIGTLNQQLVEIYETELRGVLASVEVFKAQVEAANSQIQIELGKIEIYKANIDAYGATINGERVKFEMYSSQVGAEETKAQVYTAQVDAYSSRIGAFKTTVDAEVAKVSGQATALEAQTRIYGEEVNAWSQGMAADTANLEAFVNVYRAELEKYTAMLSAEQYRVTGEARNVELDIEQEKARVAGSLKNADQRIEQLKHVTALGLSATETAAKTNAQLAASSMSAINVSAGMNSSNSVSGTDSRSCNTNYTASVSA